VSSVRLDFIAVLRGSRATSQHAVCLRELYGEIHDDDLFDGNEHLIGMLSLGDVASEGQDDAAATLIDNSEPTEPDRSGRRG
jgi:hypothetical protein